MSYEFYKILHLLGLAGILVPLGALAQHALSGGTKDSLSNRKFLMILHGVSMLILFVAGFGLMARLGISFSSVWIWIKLAIWLFMGGAAAIALRQPALARTFFLLLPALVGVATYLARYKPF